MTYSIKSIKTQITLAAGSFKGGGNSRTVEGLATDAQIEKIGLPDFGKAHVKITGMKYDDMAQLTMLAFRPLQSARNVLTIWAGDYGGALSRVFVGEIMQASADFNAAPEVSFNIEAFTGAYGMQIAKPPVAVQGSTPAAGLVSQFSTEAGYVFKNEGVTAAVSNSVFNGSPIEKARAVANQIGAELLIDDDTITLLPAGKSLGGNIVPMLSAESGLLGYPNLTAQGISLRCNFNPDLKLFGSIKVNTIVPRASGRWRIFKLTHALSAFRPGGGPWESQIEAMWEG